MVEQKYRWSILDNNSDLIHQIEEGCEEKPSSVIFDLEKQDKLEMLHLTNGVKNFAVDIRSGLFYIGDMAFHPCADVLNIIEAKNKEVNTLTERKYKEMATLNKFKQYENKADIDELSEKQLRQYNWLKHNITLIEKELTAIKYRVIYFKRMREDAIISFDGNIKSVKMGGKYIYGHFIGWQIMLFGVNYQRMMFISELYDNVFEIQSKR